MNDFNGSNGQQDELQAALGGNFNAGELAEKHRAPAGFVDPGTYGLRILEAKFKDTNAGNGKYLELATEIGAPGEFDGAARIYLRFNLVNPSEKAVRIAQIEFAALSVACGFGDNERPQMSQLPGRTFVADVDFELGDPDGKGGFWPDKNVITKYHRKGAESPSGPSENKIGTVERMQASRYGSAAVAQPTQDQSFNDDDIPF